jgi:RNA polymerase sigma-70 factor, ECF subfamily
LPSDEQIIRRVRKGSTDDFRELMRRHQDAVFRLAYRITCRREDAEDVVQETFLRVYRSLEDYRGNAGFRPWVRRIAINVCLRRLSVEIPSDEVEEIYDSAHSEGDVVEDAVLKQVQREDVRRAVSGLPAAYRTVVVLRYMEDLSYKEIAELLDEPMSTIQVRLHRAKKMLNRRLAVLHEM